MKKLHHRFDRLPAAQPLRRQSCCSFNSPCVRCSLIRLTSHRFAIFHKKFGRLPELNDELFFDETLTKPVRASQEVIRNQIFSAAQAHGLDCFALLSYLGLSATATCDERSL